MAILKVFALILPLLFPALAFSDDLGLMRLSLIEGDVQVQIQDTSDWMGATINLPVNAGDRLWVQDQSRAELQIQGGVYARADDNTSLDVLTIAQDSAQFYLDRGHLYINNRRGGVKTVQVDTPASSLRSYDNSIMMVDVAEDGRVEVSVLKGFIYAENRAGATRVSAGNTLTISSESSAELAPIGTPDDWERWNMDRDRRSDEWSESSRYLPDELHEYTADFDENGRWAYANDYGYVWTPTVVAAGWAPYTYGTWVWFRGSNVWVSYDPWGWAPCHYGRWVYLSSYGWSWIPPPAGAAYWGPGYVGWIVTPTYVAWVPLAPGEIYYGYGYYGPGSVNLRTVNAGAVVVNRRTYINARASNGVVVVSRESFGTGRRDPVRLGENPFEVMERRNIADVAIAPPLSRPSRPVTLAPDSGGRQPRGRQPREERTAPPTQPAQRVAPSLPPERVRNTRPEQLMNDRRIVREREGSVFKQRQPDNLPVIKMKQPRVIIRRPERQQGQQQQQQQQQQQGTGSQEQRDREQRRERQER